jgi:ABC-type bacteriocin/lantibiotic exporter with double-glycine peptidase domain
VLLEFAIATVCMGLFDALAAVSLDVAGARLGTRLQKYSFHVMLEQDIEYFESRKTGDSPCNLLGLSVDQEN